MAKQRATLEKKTPAAQPVGRLGRAIDLYCDTCHSLWTEACLAAWEKCPFVDCKGTLRTTPPPSVAKPRRPPKDRSLPLLERSGLL